MNQEKFVSIAVFLLRIVSGYVFVLSGGVKLFNWLGGTGMESLPTLILVAGIIELVGGAMILLGLFTRYAAFVSSGEMAVAYFMGHVAPGGDILFPVANGGLPAVLLCFIFLFLAANGAGSWSLDSMLKGRKMGMSAVSQEGSM